MKAMLLSAGLGRRMLPLTKNMPKCMVEVNGKPLIYYHLRALAKADTHEAVINLGWHGRQIRDYVERETNFNLTVSYSKESHESPLETGGGIRNALPLLGEMPFMVLNSDIWTDYPLQNLSSYKMGQDVLAYLVLTKPAHGESGDYVLRDQQVGLCTQSNIQMALSFSGMSVLSPRLFEIYCDATTPARFPLSLLLEKAITNRQVHGTSYLDGEWRDIGNVKRLNQLRVDVSKVTQPL